MKKVLLFLIFSLTFISSAFSQTTEFILCFPYTDTPYEPSKSVYLSSYDDSAVITFTCRSVPSYKKVILLAPHEYYRYILSKDISPDINSSEDISDNAVLVNSTAPISCYYQNTNDLVDQDGTFAIAKNLSGTSYRIMSYNNYLIQKEPPIIFSGEFVFAAFEDGTEIDVNVTAPTLNSIDTIPKMHFSLSQGQCVQIRCSEFSSTYDITGSLITSNKPIAVYSAHKLTVIPADYGKDYDESYFLEATPSVSNWGQHFLCKRLAPREQFDDTIDILPQWVFEVVRVLADSNNTIVRVNDTLYGTLQAGGFCDIEVRDRLYIETSKPSLVAEYGHSGYRDGVDSVGGPFMAILPPLEQRYNDLTFFSQADDYDGEWKAHYMVITGNVSIRNNLIFDGKSLPDTGFVNLPYSFNGEQFTIGSYLIDSGMHHISTSNSTEKGMTLLLYGYGNGIGYGYGGGALNKVDVQNKVSESPVSGNKFSLYPNPSLDELKIDLQSKTTQSFLIEIYDALGVKVYSGIWNIVAGLNSIRLDTKSYSSGMYLIRMGEESQHFVKVK